MSLVLNAATSSVTRDDGDGSIAFASEDGLHDYALRSNFEAYSVPVEVLSGESTLLGLSSSRRAAELLSHVFVVVCVRGR